MAQLERVQTVVVGGGQAGLAAGHELARRGVDFVILEVGERVGDQWRRRWDSLRLFTPARYDALPGSTFPAPAGSFPTKDAVADYLEEYARAGRLPVRTGVRALRVSRCAAGYRVATTAGEFEAASIVLATGNERPKLPAFAAQLTPEIRQLHAGDYRNASQLSGEVLVVGAGTSGVEIAIESARAGHSTVLAGRSTGSIPPLFYSFQGRIFWFFATRVASVRTPIGRRMRPRVLSHGAPLIRVKMRDAIAAGVRRAPRVVGVEQGLPVLADGRRVEPGTVVWCTGFTRDYSWIEGLVPGADGHPVHRDGVAPSERGIYFLGLTFQTRLASGLVGGVGEDARLVASEIERRLERAAGYPRAHGTEAAAAPR